MEPEKHHLTVNQKLRKDDRVHQGIAKDSADREDYVEDREISLKTKNSLRETYWKRKRTKSAEKDRLKTKTVSYLRTH